MPDPLDGAAPSSEAPIAEWLVDGFNVLHVALGGRVFESWWNEEGRGLVIERAARLSAQGERVTVVFDGDRAAEREREDAAASGLRIVFARDADKWLLRAAREAPDPGAVAVVTADRSLADRARRKGSLVVSPGEFLTRCGETAPPAQPLPAAER